VFEDPNNKNIGIGTENPKALLHIEESVAAGTAGKNVIEIHTVSEAPNSSPNAIVFYNNLAGPNISFGMQLDYDGRFRIFRGSATGVDFGITKDGLVGIGTSDPFRKLTVEQPIPPDLITQILRLTGSTAGNLSDGQAVSLQFAFKGLGYHDDVADIVVARDGADRAAEIWFRSRPPTGPPDYLIRMVIKPSGNIGIGNRTPQYKLDVDGDINATGCVRAGGNNLGGTCSSDKRMKTVLSRFQHGLENLLKLQPIVYRYNGLGEIPVSTQDEYGFLAEEVENIAPDLVETKQVQLHVNDDKKIEY
jgi:hypothetical protein